MTSVFGEIFVASELEEAVITTLKKWYPTYLRHVEEKLQLPVGKLVGPRVYTNRNNFDAIPGDDMPMCVVISPGLHDEPITRERGKYTAAWSLGVGIAIAADTETKANAFSKIYGAAARAIVLHNSVKETDFVTNVTYLDETYDDLPIEDQLQQYRAAGVYFAIEVENVVDKYRGPAEPDADPYDPLGQVQEVIVDVGRI